MKESPSRRFVVKVAAATISLPILESALGRLRPAEAAAAAAGASGQNASPEGSGFFSTGLAPADVKNDQFTTVKGHKVLLVRQGDKITAMTSICTHRGCTLTPTPGLSVMTCGCHKAQYNLDGKVLRGPATVPLRHYAVRLNDKGMIEVDPGDVVVKDAKESVLVAKPTTTQPV